MSCFRRFGCVLRFGLPAVMLLPMALIAAERPKESPQPTGTPVDIFSAIEAGQIEARLITKDSSQCRLMVKNKTDKLLSVRLPEAFAGVPVLAQWPNNFNNNQGNNNRQDALQGVGVGNPIFNQPGNGGPVFNLPNQGNPRGNNFFSIPPEKVGQLKLSSVCLDHGKPEPRPAARYEIKPLAEYTQKPGVAQVCVMLGRGEISQRTAQLAAWHLNNDMSWEKLADMRRKLATGTELVYSRKQLDAGKEAAEKAVELAKKSRPANRGEATSLSME